jgi:hypothetical protein
MSAPSYPSVRPDSTAHLSELSDIERQILASIHAIRFGSLEIVIHDSRIVQIERTEKTRFDAKGKALSEAAS